MFRWRSAVVASTKFIKTGCVIHKNLSWLVMYSSCEGVAYFVLGCIVYVKISCAWLWHPSSPLWSVAVFPVCTENVNQIFCNSACQNWYKFNVFPYFSILLKFFCAYYLQRNARGVNSLWRRVTAGQCDTLPEGAKCPPTGSQENPPFQIYNTLIIQYLFQWNKCSENSYCSIFLRSNHPWQM